MEFLFKRTYRGKLRAVILDWAGTTVDFGCMASVGTFVEVFKRKGIFIRMEQARAPMGQHKRDHIAEIARMEQVSRLWREKHGRPFTAKDIDELYQDFVELQLSVLARHARLIPGTLEVIKDFRSRRLRIGSTTGYTRQMMEIVAAEARKQGYEPDSLVCSDQVPVGRPHPWMCLQNAMLLQQYPMEAYVKVGDTVPDIAEGLNAGMWTVGVALTGNEMGMAEQEILELDPDVRIAMWNRIRERMHQAGAHYVVDGLDDMPDILDDINARLVQGERP